MGYIRDCRAERSGKDILIPHLLQDVFDKLKREKFQLKTKSQRARLRRASFVF